MPIVALAIEKEVTFQGAANRYSNVYTLDSGLADLSDDWSGVANAIKDIEASVMTSDVTFRGYRVWNLGGSAAERVIVDAGDLAGAGAGGGGNAYMECAVLVRWPLSRSPVLRRRRWLSKWLHCPSLVNSTLDAVKGKTQLAPSDVANIKTKYVDAISDFIAVDGTHFSDATGEVPGEGFVKPWLEHRQFHRG